jgi:hypothetical protein
MTGQEAQPTRATEKRPAEFVRGDIEQAAEDFVRTACSALDLLWEEDDIEAEACDLTDRAFGWRDE